MMTSRLLGRWMKRWLSARAFVALGCAAAVSLAAGRAQAYAFEGYCNGTPMKWAITGTLKFYRNTCSIPDGSEAAGAFDNAGFQWRKIVSASTMEYAGRTYPECTYTSGNNRSEVALISPGLIGGLYGLTLRLGTCPSGAPGYYKEADVLLSNDLYYGPQDESFWGYQDEQQGRVVWVHEYGHALGLAHSEWLDIMRTYVPDPLSGGNTAQPYPDDATGARVLYGSLGTSNVFASAQMLSGGQVSATGLPNTYNVARGSNIIINRTVCNNGTSDLYVTERIFLSTGPYNASGGITLLSAGTWVWAGYCLSPQATLTIPVSTPPGLYWILWQYDQNNAVAEFNEADNTVHSASTLQVLP